MKEGEAGGEAGTERFAEKKRVKGAEGRRPNVHDCREKAGGGPEADFVQEFDRSQVGVE